MSRVSEGSITLFDVNDGSNPINARLLNGNHTFIASNTGVIQGTTRQMYQDQVEVYVGNTLATYNTTTSVNNTFRITGLAYVGTATGWGSPQNDNAGIITIPSITNTAVASVSLQVTISVTQNDGTLRTGLILTSTLSILRDGAGGSAVNISATKGSFRADAAGTLIAGQTAAIILITIAGLPGALRVSTSVNGAAFITQANTSNGIGGIAGFDTDLAGNFQTGTISGTSQRLSFSAANFGTSEQVVVRVEGSAGGSESTSFYRVQPGAAGADATITTIASLNNGAVFQNAAGVPKVLQATVFDAGDGTILSGANVSYAWRYTEGGATVRVTSSTVRTVVASGGVEANGTDFRTITVGPEDVMGVEDFTCRSTVTG